MNVTKGKEVSVVIQLGERLGYGNLMEIVSAVWRFKNKQQGIPEWHVPIPVIIKPDGTTLINKEDIDNEKRVYDDMVKNQVGDSFKVEQYGYWKYDPNGNDWGISAWCCSECGAKNDNLGYSSNINPYAFVGSKYCPNCGIRMRKRNENDELR